MKKSKFINQQVAFTLQQAKTGTPVEDVCRKMGVSQATFDQVQAPEWHHEPENSSFKRSNLQAAEHWRPLSAYFLVVSHIDPVSPNWKISAGYLGRLGVDVEDEGSIPYVSTQEILGIDLATDERLMCPVLTNYIGAVDVTELRRGRIPQII